MSAEAILQNIKKARGQYDFEDAPCHLVEDYDKSEERLDALRMHRVGQVTRDILKEII